MGNKKIVIIGLDGGTWDVLGPVCDQNLMPHLNRFRQEGCWGVLRSVHPPITPAAWVSFMTGQHPGRHGIFGFQKYDPATHRTHLTNSTHIPIESIWQKLSRHHKRVVAIGIPMTYPPMPVNGYLVTGFETPSIDCDFTYPPEFKYEILDQIPDFKYQRRSRRKQLSDLNHFREYIKWLKRQAEQSVEIMQLAMAKDSWDVAMVHINSFDELSHPLFRLLDIRRDSSSDTRAEMIPSYYHDLDTIIGRLCQIAETHEAVVFIVSDHGVQLKQGTLYPNTLLQQHHYLKTYSKMRLRWDRMLSKYLLHFSRNRRLVRRNNRHRLWKQIQWKHTRAFIPETNIYANLYLHMQNKQPQGIVEPAEASTLLEEIRVCFQEQVGPKNELLFPLVARPQELYELTERIEHLPDLMIVPREGFEMRSRLSDSVFHLDDHNNSYVGTHSMKGMFAAMGPFIQGGKKVNAKLIDVTPTVLGELKLPVSKDMDGRIINEIFCDPLSVTQESSPLKDRKLRHEFSEGENVEIENRLIDLGYLG